MADAKKFTEEVIAGYSPKGGSITIGAGVLDGAIHPEALVKIPLATMNRHGLIAGATGTGKTKTLQRTCRRSCFERCCCHDDGYQG
jgi:DNA helicase HerA-like ATPase